MRYFSWKIPAIILLALALGYVDLPEKYKLLPFIPKALNEARIHLGLDLQGGSQLDYKIDLRKVPEADRKAIVEGVKEVINKRVNSLGVSEPNIYLSELGDEQHIIVELAGIKDLEEAKATVGKTIQLEFKEQKETLDPGEKDSIRKQAQGILQKVLSQSKDFSLIGNEEMNANPGKVEYKIETFLTKEQIVDTKLADEVFKARTGTIIPRLIEARAGYIMQNDEIVPQEGFFIVNVQERQTKAKEEEIPPEVEASHILIAYKGAQKATENITRSRREAKRLATEVLEKIADGPFEELAKQYSDDPSSKEAGGKLAEAVKKDGIYDKDFTEAALALEKPGAFSDITETQFGFHIIRADSIKPAETKTTNEELVKYESIFFSAMPDPWKETALTGQHFVHADVQFDQLFQPYISIAFNEEGAKLFEQLTENNINKPLAIFVGGSLVSSPNVKQKISGGQAVIEGSFTPDEAQALARDLNTGAIPAPVILTGQYTIGASLGQEALASSVKAGIIGLILVMIFMVLYYRLPGFIASIALSIYAVILLFALKADLYLPIALGIATVLFIVLIIKVLKSDEGGWEKLISGLLSILILFFVAYVLSSPIVLTLAGVAGVILSIGMAVDANILIFERLKEELSIGRPVRDAVEIGFDRAWSSIRDSNFSSLITCAILFYFGSSIIQGFAFNLALGILISMVTAITVTRAFLLLLIQTRLGNHLWIFGLSKKSATADPNMHYSIIERSAWWFALSGTMIGISVISLATLGLKLSIDFRSGTLIDVGFEKQAAVEEIRSVLTELSQDTTISTAQPTSEATTTLKSATEELPKDFRSAVIVPSGENHWIIRTEHMDNDTHDDLLNAFEEKFGAVSENRFTTIGPTVGETLKRKALIALSIAFIVIVLYIAFAFRKLPKAVYPWRFGICAVIALIHDVLITVGVFSIFQFEVDALFITAILTVIGFSVHDTIVVFDRIRENLRLRQRDETLIQTANKSLTQTMARSINTSLSTLITLAALLIFGSPSIFHFVLALVIGVVVGTYSSIFTASPLLVWWEDRKKDR